MDTFPGSPRLLKGGLVLIDPDTSAIRRVIVLQYNPETLTRTLQVQPVSTEGGDRSEALRLKGPPIETIKFDAEIDATDQLEFPDQNQNAIRFGISPQLSALETIIYPTSSQLTMNSQLAQFGTLEILPMETPLALFVWSALRVTAVRITELSITEEAHDPHLNPIRAKVTLGLRVLSIDDLGFQHKGGALFMSYLRQKENLAGMANGAIDALGLRGVP